MPREPLTAQQLVRLPAALAARLDREACLQGRSKPDLVRVAVEQMLDRQDTWRMQEAMSRA